MQRGAHLNKREHGGSPRALAYSYSRRLILVLTRLAPSGNGTLLDLRLILWYIIFMGHRVCKYIALYLFKSIEWIPYYLSQDLLFFYCTILDPAYKLSQTNVKIAHHNCIVDHWAPPPLTKFILAVFQLDESWCRIPGSATVYCITVWLSL